MGIPRYAWIMALDLYPTSIIIALIHPPEPQRKAKHTLGGYRSHPGCNLENALGPCAKPWLDFS